MWSYTFEPYRATRPTFLGDGRIFLSTLPIRARPSGGDHCPDVRQFDSSRIEIFKAAPFRGDEFSSSPSEISDFSSNSLAASFPQIFNSRDLRFFPNSSGCFSSLSCRVLRCIRVMGGEDAHPKILFFKNSGSRDQVSRSQEELCVASCPL